MITRAELAVLAEIAGVAEKSKRDATLFCRALDRLRRASMLDERADLTAAGWDALIDAGFAASRDR